MVLAGDARNFKDELDILRNKCEKMVREKSSFHQSRCARLSLSLQTKLESTIDAYKIKMEEMSDLRQQIKYLEETNLRLFDEKSNLEQEYKQAKLLQTQVEFHKRTNQELYQKISELQRLADKADFERTRAEERFAAINAEKLVRRLDERPDLTFLPFDRIWPMKLNSWEKQMNNCVASTSMKVTRSIAFVDWIISPSRLAGGTNNPQDQLTGSLEDLNFLNLPADVR